MNHQTTSSAAILSPDQHAADMADYLAEGQARALSLGNRGPLRFDDSGKLDPEILAAYWRHGFYVFDDVIGAQEIDELRVDVETMIDRAPVRKGATVDAAGRPAYGRDLTIEPYLFIKPLSDPWGGTKLLSGRHQTQMTQPQPDDDAPDEVVHLMSGMCQSMPAALRLYGHPGLLGIAEAINGSDFVPYNDAIFVKKPGLGGSVSWHQDGVTHWDSPRWDEGIHGFNFQVQLYATTPANALWAVPGTHKQGKIDIKALVGANAGSDRLPGAVPLVCGAGGVTIANRQVLHGSFANTSHDPRVSITFGFHRRSSILGVEGRLSLRRDNGPVRVFDEQAIFDRAAVIPVAIDARHKHFPTESPFHYEPFAGLEHDFRYNDENFERVIRDYNTRDLAI